MQSAARKRSPPDSDNDPDRKAPATTHASSSPRLQPSQPSLYAAAANGTGSSATSSLSSLPPDNGDSSSAPAAQRPAKKRKLDVSPPWKNASAQTPTAFIVNGRRKSGRRHALPQTIVPTEMSDDDDEEEVVVPMTRQRESEDAPEPRETFDRPRKPGRPPKRRDSVGSGSGSKRPWPASKTPYHRRTGPEWAEWRKVYEAELKAKAERGEQPPSPRVPRKPGRPPKGPRARRNSDAASVGPPRRPRVSAKTTPRAPPPPPAPSPLKPSPAIGPRRAARIPQSAEEEEKKLILRSRIRDYEAILNGVSESEISSLEPDSDDEEEEHVGDGAVAIKKVKLKFGVPRPTYSHPSQIPSSKEFSSFDEFLNQEDPAYHEELLADAEEEADYEAELRNEIDKEVIDGVLAPGKCSANQPERQAEPRRQYAQWDHVVAAAINFQRLLVRERKEHTEMMRKRNAMVMAEIKKRTPRTKEEIEQEEYVDNRRTFKDQISQLKRKWDEVTKEVEKRRIAREEEKRRQAGKKHLENVLSHSRDLLRARRGLDDPESPTTPSNADEDMSGEEGDHEGSEDSDSEGEKSDEMSDSGSDEEDDDGSDEDKDLTREQLQAKYGDAVSRPTTGGKALMQPPPPAADDTPIDVSDDEMEFDDMGQYDREPSFFSDDMDDVQLLDPDSFARSPRSPEYEEDDMTPEPEMLPYMDEAETPDREAGQDDEARAVPELEQVDDALMDSEDDSTDMDSGSDDEEDEEEEESDDDEGMGGLLGFFGGKKALLEGVQEASDESEDEFKPEHEEPEVPKVNGHKSEEPEPEPEADVSMMQVDEPSPKPIEDVPMVNGQMESVEVETTTSISQNDPKDSGPHSSPTTSLETTPQPGSNKTPVPFLLRGTLREYQHYGLDWLAGLYDNHTNGILADEMGLGKTIQTIALLSHLACEKEVWGPHLVVVPTSVILNWEMEFKKWAPGFKILTYYGSKEERAEKRKGWLDNNLWHVCITSYQLVLQDQVTFKRRNWHYLILDEAHNIKNFRSQRWQTLLNFKAEARLLLTGTPLQNNLIELWSLLYFLMPSGATSMPEGFANLQEFQQWFAHPVDQIIEGGRDGMDQEARTTVTKLHQVLRPYLLRRLKADVEKQMPGKYEHVVYCRLSKRQRYLYDDFMSMAKTRETLASGNYLSIINCLMQLRKVCNHPDLFETRQIVTSFAMQRSAVSNYETKEVLIRRKLLAEDHLNPLFDKGLLEFCGLVPAKHNMSSTEVDTISKLSATETVRRVLAHREAAIRPIEPDYSSIEGFARHKAYKGELSALDRLKTCVRLNKRRTQYRPLVSSNLVQAVTSGISTTPLPPTPRHRSQITDHFLSTSETLRSMLPTLTKRAESLETTITKFGCVTPAVVATDMSALALSTLTEPLTDLARTFPDPFHAARVRLSIAFPDKRLLQYDCGKLQRLDALLRTLQAGGHRALIFTQMTRVLDILEQFLNIHGHRYLRLDGATKVEQRQILTDRFNNDPRIPVFILSTRSGGLGINLTGADTVIFYDLDWNPAMDKQCQDRCHRIGQTRDVHIYRFVSEFTIESNILRKSERKRMLDDVVIQEGCFTTEVFEKLSIRDMLGDEVVNTLAETEEGVKEVVDRPLVSAGMAGNAARGRGRSMEAALEAAEDVEDAAAAKVAQREVVDADGADFAQSGAVTEAPTPRETTVAVDSAAAAAAVGEKVVQVQEPEQEEEKEPDHVDEYMIRLVEWELRDVPVTLPSKIRDKRKRNKKGKPF